MENKPISEICAYQESIVISNPQKRISPIGQQNQWFSIIFQ